MSKVTINLTVDLEQRLFSMEQLSDNNYAEITGILFILFATRFDVFKQHFFYFNKY